MSNAESSGSLQGPSPCFSPVPFQFHPFPVVDLRSTLRPDPALKVSLSEILQLSRSIIRYWLFLAERESGLFSPARDPNERSRPGQGPPPTCHKSYGTEVEMMKSYEWMREYDPPPAKTKTTGHAATTSATHYGFTLLTENARGRTHPGILPLVYCLRNKSMPQEDRSVPPPFLSFPQKQESRAVWHSFCSSGPRFSGGGDREKADLVHAYFRDTMI